MRRTMLFAVIFFAAIVANAWALNVMTDPALVGLWLCDEGSGTVLRDSSGNANDATINGDFAWDNGKFGGAIVASGGGSIDVPVSDSLNTVTGAITIAAWFRVDADSDTGIRRPNAYLLEDQSDSEMEPDGFSFRIWTTAGLSPGVYGTTKLTQGEWYHVAGTYDGEQMMLYINGVPEEKLYTDGKVETDGKWSGDIGTPGDALQLKYGSESYTGAMDEIVLFNRALDADEIKDLMKGATATTTAVEARGKLAVMWGAIK